MAYDYPNFRNGRSYMQRNKSSVDIESTWDSSLDDYNITQTIDWLENDQVLNFNYEKLQSYLKVGDPGHINSNIYDFCDEKLYESINKAKCIFEDFNRDDIQIARGRANLFERISSLFFMNRAAVKLANIDAVFNFMLTNIDKHIHHCDSKGPFYFADVCAGPGGFTEYILWRKSWLYKGFGFTLQDDNDFKLYESSCTAPFTFQTFYGSTGDGNICCPDNITDFKTKVLFQTHQKGVHFMTSDGGFSVEGNESSQEILSKNIYLCQCLVALEIVRSHGIFVTKMFDVYTRFSVGLIYLMYKCFKKVAILKPNASRPANGERYLICYDLQNNDESKQIRKYLRFLSTKLWQLKDKEDCDLLELMPMKIIKNDSKFYDYILSSNNKLGIRQLMALKKLRFFCENPTVRDPRQIDYRSKSLNFWQLPDHTNFSIKRENSEKIKIRNEYFVNTDWLKLSPIVIGNKEFLSKFYNMDERWSFCALYSTREKNKCNIYAALGTRTHRWQGKHWVRVKNLKLSPGTILYGEIVKETLRYDLTDVDSDHYRPCLHIIDAMYLGDTCLTELAFSERMDLIAIYAESLNPEFDEKRIRIRKKPIHSLNLNTLSGIIRNNCDNLFYEHVLPILGFHIEKESHRINSILFLRNRRFSEDVPQQLMFSLRAQLFLDENDVGLFKILLKELK